MERIETLRTQERGALLERLRATLRDDPRVLAAWLHGSLGRGDGDAWSDLDVWVVLRDDVQDDRHAFAQALGGVVFTEEAPQNGPPGGAYLMSAHDAPTGPHLVDWYFQPLRFASAGEGRVPLVERVPLPKEPVEVGRTGEWSPTAEEEAANQAALFWAMLLVQAKYVARKPVEAGMGFEGFIVSLLRSVAEWRDEAVEETETPGLVLAREKLARLRSLGGAMARVAPGLSGPQGAVGRFLDSVEASLPLL